MTAPEIRESISLGDYYAEMISGRAGVRDARVRAAFSAVPREAFLGPGPWLIGHPSGGGYVRTPSDDLAFVYSDVVVGLIPERRLNNGEPSFHARCLQAVAIQPGETVVHVGAGAGYYTAIMAEITGPAGRVEALEIDPDLAARAARNLEPWPQARVQSRSGLDAPFPEADVIYVNAGVSALAEAWMDAIRPGGRLLVPLTAGWMGAVLLFTHVNAQLFEARTVSPTAIIPCVGGQDEVMAKRLTEAFGSPGSAGATAVRSLRRGTLPDDSCWLAGDSWWLSTATGKA